MLTLKVLLHLIKDGFHFQGWPRNNPVSLVLYLGLNELNSLMLIRQYLGLNELNTLILIMQYWETRSLEALPDF